MVELSNLVTIRFEANYMVDDGTNATYKVGCDYDMPPASARHFINRKVAHILTQDEIMADKAEARAAKEADEAAAAERAAKQAEEKAAKEADEAEVAQKAADEAEAKAAKEIAEAVAAEKAARKARKKADAGKTKAAGSKK